jgi:hypothetical protein
MYLWYNNILRYLHDTSGGYQPDMVKGLKLAGEFVTTTHAINSCILVQSRQQVACKVWRGVKGGVLPKQFWEMNTMGVKGATQGSMCLVNDTSHVSAVAIYLTARWY